MTITEVGQINMTSTKYIFNECTSTFEIQNTKIIFILYNQHIHSLNNRILFNFKMSFLWESFILINLRNCTLLTTLFLIEQTNLFPNKIPLPTDCLLG